MRYAIKKDDILRHKITGEMFVATTGEYTHRFMDHEDHEMVDHGMGEYAGSYGTAVMVTSTMTGTGRRLRLSQTRKNYDNVTAMAEVLEEEVA